MTTTDAITPGIPDLRGREPRPAWWAFRGPLAVGAATLVAAGAVAVYSPYRPGSYGLCPIFALTGLYCPACGGLRAAHDLSQLDVAAAWAMNPAVVVLTPMLAVAWVVWFTRAARGGSLRLPVWAAWASLAAFVAFGVARNTPVLSWLAVG